MRSARTARAVCGLPLPQTEALTASVMRLLGLHPPGPAYTTLSRGAAILEVPGPRSSHNADPVHLLVDSTGLKLCGPGEWLVEKHGTKSRRSWKKLHLGRGAELTSHDVDDGSQVGPLLDQMAGAVASVTGDGAFDQDGV